MTFHTAFTFLFINAVIAVSNGLWCDYFMSDRSGTIQSPNYPNNYVNNASCSWTIFAGSGHTIRFEFEDFSLEADKDCRYDYITVNGSKSSDNIKMCGSITPSPIEAERHSMTLRFRSDGSVSSRGFKLTYTVIENVLEGQCGGNLTAESGAILSPNYPLDYVNNLDCLWTIRVPEGRRVVLSINDFAVQTALGLCYLNDFLILNHTVTRNNVKLCGRIQPAVIYAEGNTVSLHFITSPSGVYSGFNITYTTVADDSTCGGIITESPGVVITKGYPHGYNTPPINCYWNFVAPEYQTIQLNFISSNFLDNCDYDAAEVYDFTSEFTASFIKLCGDLESVQVNSTTNRLMLHLANYYAYAKYSGFKLSYRFLDSES